MKLETIQKIRAAMIVIAEYRCDEIEAGKIYRMSDAEVESYAGRPLTLEEISNFPSKRFSLNSNGAARAECRVKLAELILAK